MSTVFLLSGPFAVILGRSDNSCETFSQQGGNLLRSSLAKKVTPPPCLKSSMDEKHESEFSSFHSIFWSLQHRKLGRRPKIGCQKTSPSTKLQFLVWKCNRKKKITNDNLQNSRRQDLKCHFHNWWRSKGSDTHTWTREYARSPRFVWKIAHIQHLKTKLSSEVPNSFKRWDFRSACTVSPNTCFSRSQKQLLRAHGGKKKQCQSDKQTCWTEMSMNHLENVWQLLCFLTYLGSDLEPLSGNFKITDLGHDKTYHGGGSDSWHWCNRSFDGCNAAKPTAENHKNHLVGQSQWSRWDKTCFFCLMKRKERRLYSL